MLLGHAELLAERLRQRVDLAGLLDRAVQLLLQPDGNVLGLVDALLELLALLALQRELLGQRGRVHRCPGRDPHGAVKVAVSVVHHGRRMLGSVHVADGPVEVGVVEGRGRVVLRPGAPGVVEVAHGPVQVGVAHAGRRRRGRRSADVRRALAHGALELPGFGGRRVLRSSRVRQRSARPLHRRAHGVRLLLQVRPPVRVARRRRVPAGAAAVPRAPRCAHRPVQGHVPRDVDGGALAGRPGALEQGAVERRVPRAVGGGDVRSLVVVCVRLPQALQPARGVPELLGEARAGRVLPRELVVRRPPR
mmetsp:Transcript_33514/g.94070  ORF Transcript_33514/g.94070 Transcript_33514/m.94070 type:complete len:306 (+) Transcript_33514:535-1452(+)